MKRIILVAFLATAGMSGNMFAQKPELITSDSKGWHKIGETKVDFLKDHDELRVMGANRFAKIKFNVKEQAIHFNKVEITYESGDNQIVELDFDVKAPGESKLVDLPGGERNVKKIIFYYRSISNEKGEKARLEIWGLKTNK